MAEACESQLELKAQREQLATYEELHIFFTLW
jgi:hypothetical protein